VAAAISKPVPRPTPKPPQPHPQPPPRQPHLASADPTVVPAIAITVARAITSFRNVAGILFPPSGFCPTHIAASFRKRPRPMPASTVRNQNVLSGYNFGERPIGGPWSNTVHSFQAAVRCNIRLKAKVTDVCFGSKADICSAFTHVRFTPESECDKWNVR